MKEEGFASDAQKKIIMILGEHCSWNILSIMFHLNKVNTSGELAGKSLFKEIQSDPVKALTYVKKQYVEKNQ